MALYGKILRSGATTSRSLLSAALLVGVVLLGGCDKTAPAQLAVDAKGAGTADIGTPKHMRLLTLQQYISTIQYFFGADIKIDSKFAPLPREGGMLMAGASVGGTSDAQMETYQNVANLVSLQVVDANHRDALFPCKPADARAADNACASKFLTRVIDYLYFLPPPKEHVTNMINQAGAVANTIHSFYGGIQVVLENMLLNPDVLLVIENQEPDPNRPGHMRLDAPSQAARLSLFLWNAAPDQALRAAAARGDLFDAKKRARVVDAMLASPRLEMGVRAFFDDMFGLETMETVTKDANVYPYFLGGLISDAREQTLRTAVDLLLTKNGDYRDIFTTRSTFISPALGILYGVQALPGWRPYEFPAEAHRAGILTQASFLAMHSQATRSSATLRGKALREMILCQKVPPPPPNVDFSVVANPPANLKTARQQLDFHQKNPVCAGCHKIMDPIGLALENFDGAGRYRDNEKGEAIETGGTMDGKAFPSVDGLGPVLHDSPAVPRCLVQRAVTYAAAGVPSSSAAPMLEDLNKTFASNGYRLKPLLRAIALNPAFSKIDEASPLPTENKTASASIAN